MIAQIIIPRPRITTPGTALVAKSLSSASVMESNGDSDINVSINHVAFPPKPITRPPARKLRKRRPLRVKQAQNSTGIDLGNDGGHPKHRRIFNFLRFFKFRRRNVIRGDATNRHDHVSLPPHIGPLSANDWHIPPLLSRPASGRHDHMNISLPLGSPHIWPLPTPSASNGDDWHIPPLLSPLASDRHDHISLPLGSSHIWPLPIPSASDGDDHTSPPLSPIWPLPTSPASDLHDPIPIPPPISPPSKGPLPNPPSPSNSHNRTSPPQRPLPAPPSIGRVSVDELDGNNGRNVVPFPSAAQLKQRMIKMKRRMSKKYRKSVGPDPEPHVGVRRDRKSGAGPSIYRGKEIARKASLASVSSWMDTDEELDLGVDEGAVLYELLLDSYVQEHGDHSSLKSDTMEQCHTDNFDAQLELRQSNEILTDALLQDMLGFKDDESTVGDRTSRWSGSVYSRLSILTKDKSEETRHRLLRRVESMLNADMDTERHSKRMARLKAQEIIPPLPKIPEKYKQNGIINENFAASRYSITTPGQSWNKF